MSMTFAVSPEAKGVLTEEQSTSAMNRDYGNFLRPGLCHCHRPRFIPGRGNGEIPQAVQPIKIKKGKIK